MKLGDDNREKTKTERVGAGAGKWKAEIWNIGERKAESGKLKAESSATSMT